MPNASSRPDQVVFFVRPGRPDREVPGRKVSTGLSESHVYHLAPNNLCKVHHSLVGVSSRGVSPPRPFWSSPQGSLDLPFSPWHQRSGLAGALPRTTSLRPDGSPSRRFSRSYTQPPHGEGRRKVLSLQGWSSPDIKEHPPIGHRLLVIWLYASSSQALSWLM